MNGRYNRSRGIGLVRIPVSRRGDFGMDVSPLDFSSGFEGIGADVTDADLQALDAQLIAGDTSLNPMAAGTANANGPDASAGATSPLLYVVIGIAVAAIAYFCLKPPAHAQIGTVANPRKKKSKRSVRRKRLLRESAEIQARIQEELHG